MRDDRRAAPAHPARRHRSPRVLAQLIAIAAILFGAAFNAIPVRAAEPKVAIIVGPAGAATAAYRAEAAQAAAAARRLTSRVVTVLSPDATWPRARAAMQGASIVIYLGHGNGWPSRYSSRLNPRVQDGLGLNPVAGVDDVAHQYFGETYLASSVRLAPDAVVLLHHLCYASGESEPGLAPAGVAVATQRVDNYAAGWMAAGAGAVIAEASNIGPAYFLRAILSGKGAVEGIWRSAPSAHGNVIASASGRTPGMTVLLDPWKPQRTFYSSLVTRADLRADEVARGAAQAPADADQPSPGAAAPGAGPTVSRVKLSGTPVAGSTLDLAVTVTGEMPASLGLGVRWDRLAREATAPPDAATGAPSAVAETGAAAEPGAAAGPGAAAEPGAAVEAVPVALVTPEAPGDVVRIAEAHRAKNGLRASVDIPAEPGLYRLVTSLHDASGVAMPAATPAPALIVRVTRPLSAAVAAPRELVLEAWSRVRMPVAVTNTGDLPWTESASPATPPSGSSPADGGNRPGPPALLDDSAPRTPSAAGPGRDASPSGASGTPDPSPVARALEPAHLVARWLRLDGPAAGAAAPDGTSADGSAPLIVADVVAAPGETAQAVLDLEAPHEAGDYLLVLDVVSPLHGSLAARGMPVVAIPVLVRTPEPPSSGGDLQ